MWILQLRTPVICNLSPFSYSINELFGGMLATGLRQSVDTRHMNPPVRQTSLEKWLSGGGCSVGNPCSAFADSSSRYPPDEPGRFASGHVSWRVERVLQLRGGPWNKSRDLAYGPDGNMAVGYVRHHDAPRPEKTKSSLLSPHLGYVLVNLD
jgi:hypothetical protein